MATFKICVFKHQKRRDDKYPVSIRVTWKKKQVYVKTEYYVSEKQINKKTFELKDTFIINELNSRIAKYETLKAQKLGSRIELYSAKELADYFSEEVKPGSDSTIDFIAFARDYCDRLKAKGKKSTAIPIISAVNAVVDFFNGRDKVAITEITSKFLFSFEDYLKSERTLKRLNQFRNTVVIQRPGLSDVSVSDYMTSLRTLFSAAMNEYNDEDKDEMRITHYPFRKYKLNRNHTTRKRNLTIAQIRQIRDVENLSQHRAILARDVFMLSFYLIGTNLVDLYEAKNSQLADGRFSYERQKTGDRRSDNAYISIKVEPEAIPLVEKYRDPSGCS